MIYKNLFPATEENIRRAAEIIKEGGVVAFPTETVYGLGADALNPKAVARIYEIKNRPSFDPLIVHVCSIDMARNLVSEIDDISLKLMERFWPGPLTIVLPKRNDVPDITTAGLKTVALRMPASQIALKLIEFSERPIAAPSANPFGYVSPTNAIQVAETLGNRVDIILDGGKTEFGIESTVVMYHEGNLYLLRPGALEVETIERYLNLKVLEFKGNPRLSPGRLPKHYSPKADVRILNDWEDYFKSKAVYGRVGLVLLKRKTVFGFKEVIYLSEDGDVKEIAYRLFDSMYKVDRMGWEKAFFQRVEEVGLGRAIMNRLKKASGIAD